MDAHYFSTAVRTGGKGLKGVSLLLIERGPGVTTKKIPTAYSASAGTSLVIFEDVKVPVGNLLGPENQGFKCIMHNFNHERWFIACISCASSRRVLEETLKWVCQRRAFGKSLMEQPHIRQVRQDSSCGFLFIMSVQQPATKETEKRSKNNRKRNKARSYYLLIFIDLLSRCWLRCSQGWRRRRPS